MFGAEGQIQAIDNAQARARHAHFHIGWQSIGLDRALSLRPGLIGLAVTSVGATVVEAWVMRSHLQVAG